MLRAFVLRALWAFVALTLVAVGTLVALLALGTVLALLLRTLVTVWALVAVVAVADHSLGLVATKPAPANRTTTNTRAPHAMLGER